MKTIFVVIAAFIVVVMPAAADEIIATTQYEDGSTNLWTQADLQDALGLVNRKYWHDMKTEEGRKAWHGQRLGQYQLTNNLGRITVVNLYEDGYVHTNAAYRPKIYDPEEAAKAARESAVRAEARRAAWEAANLPPELAALRAAQRAAAASNEVTVVNVVN